MPSVSSYEMEGCGTDEPYVIESMEKLTGMHAVSIHCRRPLALVEVNQMAPTAEVLQRPGRP
ncbi:MAG: hypothetical protein ACJ8AW_45525 [Rhodopila sp.]